MDRIKAFSAALLGGGLVAATLWVAHGLLADNRSEATVPRSQPPAPVVLGAVRLEREELRLDAVGTSRAIRSVTLFPEAAGEVAEVAFGPGEAVAAGDLLLALDARDERLALELAELRVADAQRVIDRYARAKGTDAVPITDREAAQTALAIARIERDRARVALDDRFVRAPFAGVVGLTDVEVGDRIDPSVAITTLDDRSALLVRFELPELMLGALTVGEPVTLSTWNAPGAPARGEVVEIGSQIDPVTRTVEVRARVANDEDRLRPGMSFRVELRIQGRAYPVVPEVALQWGADGAFLWRVEDGVARRLDADIVQRREGRVLVDAPLAEGDQVVTEGVQSMREGRAIEAVPFAAPPVGATGAGP